MRTQSKFAPRIEALDDRSMMSVTLNPLTHQLEVVGSTKADTIQVSLLDSETIEVTDSAEDVNDDEIFDLSEVSSILIRSRAGDDYIQIAADFPMGVEVRAWAGDDVVFGGAGND